MRTFDVTTEEGLIGEAVEFSNGEVVVRWLAGATLSRFPNLETITGAVRQSAAFKPKRPEPLGDRLRHARAESGLSQRGLSRATGVSFSTISRIEAGNNYVSNPALEKWLIEYARDGVTGTLGR